MSRLGLVVADGVGFRNFVMTNFLKSASNEFDEVIIYSGLLEKEYEKYIYKNVRIIELDIFKESKLIWFFRKLKEVAHLRQHIKSFGIKTSYFNGKPKKVTNFLTFLILLIYRISDIFHSENQILLFERIQFFLLRKTLICNTYVKYLNEDRPDILFFTHQRPYNLSPFLAAAKKLKIKSATFIFSWDNLISKGRMLGSFDGFFVWSKLMKKELLDYYPRVSENSINVVGSPQFEPYTMNEYQIEKEKFQNRFDLDKNKKTIYYSCGDVSTSKLDPFYIEVLAEFILKGIIPKVNLIVRTSPAEDNSRFSFLIDKYPFIKWNFPDWKLTRKNHVETWSQRVPSKEDIINLRGLLEYSDLNINMCSTMSLDFMLFDKPVINAVFGNGNNGMYDDQKYLNYDHYRKVVESKAVTVAVNKKELYNQIIEGLEQPDKRKIFRKNILELQIGTPLNGTSEIIVKGLQNF